MNTNNLTKLFVKQTALDWLESLGYMILSKPEIGPGELWIGQIAEIV